MQRYLVLFARDPEREAQSKGLGPATGADLFSAFASGWLAAAGRLGARVVIAAPPEDLLAWRRRLPGSDVVWLAQRGKDFGQRLRRIADEVAGLGGRAVLVGGDVVPDETAALEAFEAMDRGADAALAPAPDGGVSLIALRPQDHDLLEKIGVRRWDVFASLVARLASRDRVVAVISTGLDVDCPSDLRFLIRSRTRSVPLALARRALAASPGLSPDPPSRPRSIPSGPPSGLRAPPAA